MNKTPLKIYPLMISTFSTSVVKAPLALFMLHNTRQLAQFMLSKRSSKPQFRMRLTNNPSFDKSRSTWNLIIPTLSGFMALFALIKPFTLWWSCANLEISIKKWENLDLLPSPKLKASFAKSAAPSIISTTETSSTGTSRQKTLSFMIKLSRFAISDGPVKDNIRENLFVELLLTSHLKSFKTNFTTRKSMSGAWESWYLNLSLAEFHSIYGLKKTWGKSWKKSWSFLMKEKSLQNAKILSWDAWKRTHSRDGTLLDC